MSAERDVAILGVGMHPWGKWGRDFIEYGMVAARAALADAGLAWRDIQFVAGADTIRNGYPGFIAGATFAQKLGWTGVPRVVELRGVRLRRAGAAARRAPRSSPGFCDVALVIGADTTPKGFFAPVGGERKTDPDWLRFHLLGATNPVYFALYARRRMDVYGATADDFAQVKVKNVAHGLENPNARFRKEITVEDVVNSPIVADPLRLLDICATVRRRRGADRVEHGLRPNGTLGRPTACRASGGLDRHAALSADRIELPNFATDSAAVVAPADRVASRTRSPDAAYEEAGIGPDDVVARRGLRPVDRARARLVREHRLCAPKARPSAAARRATRRSAGASR